MFAGQTDEDFLEAYLLHMGGGEGSENRGFGFRVEGLGFRGLGFRGLGFRGFPKMRVPFLGPFRDFILFAV